MEKVAWLAVAALLLAACTPRGGPEVEAPPGEKGPEAVEAVSIAAACALKEPWFGMNEGYGLTLQRATAHHDASSGSRWQVRVPEGFYRGRLPPPRPAGAIWIQVDLASKTCAPGAAP